MESRKRKVDPIDAPDAVALEVAEEAIAQALEAYPCIKGLRVLIDERNLSNGCKSLAEFYSRIIPAPEIIPAPKVSS